MVEIIKDRDLIFETENYDVILVGTSVYNNLCNGFQSKIKYKYPNTLIEDKKTRYGDFSKIGNRTTIYGKPIISLMYICGYPKSTIESVDYEGLVKCLKTANAEFKGKKVATTIVGSSIFDGNGDREKCLNLIEENTKDLNLFIYDYEQKKRFDEITYYQKLFNDKNDLNTYLKKQYLNG